ncbi:MAG: hypothetical protein ABJF10_06845 [Chthoniobacter sp.]|uniref:hypothetical protein n=1 Tax=Chthoniobacter sp. TaxID=2510640 RepID=UPI0032A26EB0
MNPSDSNPAPQKAGVSSRVRTAIFAGFVAIAGILLASLCFPPKMAKAVPRPPLPLAEVDDSGVVVLTSTASPGPVAASVDRDATLPPRWVPSYPAAQGQDGGTRRETKDKIAGTYLAKTRDDPDKVKDYFDSTLKADGFETEVKSTSTDGNDSTMVTATVNGGKRKLTVKATSEKGVTNLVITYEGAK